MRNQSNSQNNSPSIDFVVPVEINKVYVSAGWMAFECTNHSKMTMHSIVDRSYTMMVNAPGTRLTPVRARRRRCDGGSAPSRYLQGQVDAVSQGLQVRRELCRKPGQAGLRDAVRTML